MFRFISRRLFRDYEKKNLEANVLETRKQYRERGKTARQSIEVYTKKNQLQILFAATSCCAKRRRDKSPLRFRSTFYDMACFRVSSALFFETTSSPICGTGVVKINWHLQDSFLILLLIFSFFTVTLSIYLKFTQQHSENKN